MQLSVGERLEGSGPEQQPGGYVVTGVVGETPWYGLYAAKKVFYNFDFTAKRVRETDEKEWLDVFLRTIRYPVLDQADYVAQRRVLARAEVHAILGNRHSNLWPEPIDVVELDDAIEGLQKMEPRLAQVIELFYFGGLTYDQIAASLGTSAATVHRDIRLARAWLLNEISGNGPA